MILESDKGNATVVLDSEEYERKALDVIGKQPFKRILRDLTKRNEEKVNEELKRLAKKGGMSQKTLTALRLHAGESTPPFFYGRVNYTKLENR